MKSETSIKVFGKNLLYSALTTLPVTHDLTFKCKCRIVEKMKNLSSWDMFLPLLSFKPFFENNNENFLNNTPNFNCCQRYPHRCYHHDAGNHHEFDYHHDCHYSIHDHDLKPIDFQWDANPELESPPLKVRPPPPFFWHCPPFFPHKRLRGPDDWANAEVKYGFRNISQFSIVHCKNV